MHANKHQHKDNNTNLFMTNKRRLIKCDDEEEEDNNCNDDKLNKPVINLHKVYKRTTRIP